MFLFQIFTICLRKSCEHWKVNNTWIYQAPNVEFNIRSCDNLSGQINLCLGLLSKFILTGQRWCLLKASCETKEKQLNNHMVTFSCWQTGRNWSELSVSVGKSAQAVLVSEETVCKVFWCHHRTLKKISGH